MEIESKPNSDEICRTCLVKSKSDNVKSLTSLFDGETRTVLDALCFVVNFDIKPRDSYPNHVCNDCADIIYKADAFKRRCIETEDILRLNYETCCKSKSFEIPLIKPELTVKKVKTKKENVKKKSHNKCKSTSKQEINDLLSSASTNDNYFLLDNIPNNSSNEMKLDSLLNLNNDDERVNNEIKIESECDDSQMDADYEPMDNYETTVAYKQESTEKPSKFTCSCNLEFNEENDYEKHFTSCKEHLKCNEIKLEKKNFNHNICKTKEFVCCIDCNIDFESYKSLKLHRKKIHENVNNSNDIGNFECTKCMRKFTRKSSYTYHVKHHETTEATKHICQTCKREFQYKAHLDNHILAVHSRDKGFTCELCSTNFLSQDSLDSHRESHKSERKHKCNICSKAFYMLSTLNDHLRIHSGEKPYLCSICGRGFSQKTNMAQHVARHNGLKPFKCDECDKSFVSKGELKAHKRKHTGAHPFICDECGSGFTTSSALVKHRRTHTGERPYACDLCSMRFAASGTLNNHRRTHTGEKPYQCSYCEKAFVQRQDLVSHIRCHTGERPYMCPCGLTFRKSAALRQHAKLHSNTIQET